MPIQHRPNSQRAILNHAPTNQQANKRTINHRLSDEQGNDRLHTVEQHRRPLGGSQNATERVLFQGWASGSIIYYPQK
jgi:hypothetical protein